MSKNLNRAGISPNSVSQNFLTSADKIRRLLRLTSVTKADLVIEIGAGKGHITKELIQVCRNVDAYEIDGRLYHLLQRKLEHAENLNLYHKDFLKAPLPVSIPYKVFANIPFNCTTDIMRKLTGAPNPPQEAWLAMEKGAAKRFMGKPQDTLTSLLIKPFFKVGIAYHFERHDFHPMPAVDVVLLHVSRKTQPDIPIVQKMMYHAFVEKGVRYGIRALLTKRQIATALKRASLPSIEESGTMLYVQWLCLFRCYNQLHGVSR